jgi:hypothetical protein
MNPIKKTEHGSIVGRNINLRKTLPFPFQNMKFIKAFFLPWQYFYMELDCMHYNEKISGCRLFNLLRDRHAFIYRTYFSLIFWNPFPFLQHIVLIILHKFMFNVSLLLIDDIFKTVSHDEVFIKPTHQKIRKFVKVHKEF